MKKKRATSSLARPPFKFGSKLVILVCAVLFLLAFLRLHFQTTLQSVISFYQASRVFGDDHFKCTPKIAFLFLARRNLPLDFLWGTFLKNVDTSMFSIYVHSEPGFVFNESNTRSAFFYGRQLNNSIQVEWGESSMIEAERLLFEAALDDPANQRFVLLSDSCIPLYSFGYVYSYLTSSSKSFVDSFIDVKENRYSPEMSPVIPKEKWRKGSQWIALIRRHAVIVVDDDFVFPVFRKFCKRWPPADLIKRRQILQAFVFQNGHNCIPDEHYVQTLLKMSGLENELERRTLTYSLWNQSAEAGERRSWHPFRFNHADASPQLIQDIKVINHVYYDSENRKELCHVNITIAPCFLFARKFTPLAAVRLLTERSVDLQDAASVFHAAP
ncbi:PREDICTED: uncharacterized protein LOC18612314 isoform X1 [Theobroma cacao]|uniref:Uncharacterized protein LOC18612314 isoform X1 n=1 Tax=Theobroma cacao TaxID=3641 RepID=A0AB32WY08_THECC|nr:PREDICTED: uncharacterized protein LOC18612314 isoform X1 [Theobroma cacao]